MFLFWHILLVSSFLPYLTPAQNPEEAKFLDPPQSINVSLNEVAEFNCTANSDNIVWRINDVEIDSGQIPMQIAQGLYLSTLKLTASASLDNTNITCTAVKLTPPSSNQSEPALLLVQGLLESVSNLTVTPVNSTTVLISWSPPFTLDGVPILGYNVTITNTTSGENETMSVEGDTTILYYSIDHLKSIFTITVVPINVVGEGDDASIQTTTSTTTSQAVVPSVTVTSASARATSSTTSQAVVISFTVTSDSASDKTSSDIVMPSQSPTTGNNLGAKVGGPFAAIIVLVGVLVLVIMCCIYVFRRKRKTKRLEPAAKQIGSEIHASKNIQNISNDELVDPPPAYQQVDPPAYQLVDPPADQSADLQADSPDPMDHYENPNKLNSKRITGDHAEIWFFRKLNDEEAEAKCSTAGDYLVNYNPEYEKYILIVKPKSGIHLHISIQETDVDNPQYSIGDRDFRSICDLLKEYRDEQIPLPQNSEAVLTNFVANKDWSISQDGFKLTGKVIGKGAFGDVYQAHMVRTGQQVAVKTCKSSHTDAERRNFMHEADILSHNEHQNIVKLIGVVANHHQLQLCIVMEHVGWTFRVFLKERGSECTKTQLIQMCTQVCAGMEYLEENKCVHCSLSARNCLVTVDNKTVKISNFGTSSHRRRNPLGFSDSKSQVRPPHIKWTAPEALKFGTYTSASDVWSFGILLWETFSFRADPYPGLTNSGAKDKIMVKESYTLPPRPEKCPDEVYTVMKKCLKYNEKERPKFAELQSELKMIDITKD